MLLKITAAQKGIITGIIMIVVTLVLFYSHQSFDSPLQYFIYGVYLAGIVWSLQNYSRSDQYKKFGKYFLEGFKCFVVVTLLMVIFTFIFNRMHPEFKNEMADVYKSELTKQGNATPAEIDESVIKMKDHYLTILISRTIFAYLFLGAVITGAASLVFIRKK